ncbi:MAG: hypothetical protein BWZ10_01500 [candidate division BRC1 bacterium ADurb.BinA364]|nr:MAG: hypothetical protein BWZ10_01500 [candidate division BRC1 bacterium ADurb.BinA364]
MICVLYLHSRMGQKEDAILMAAAEPEREKPLFRAPPQWRDTLPKMRYAYAGFDCQRRWKTQRASA